MKLVVDAVTGTILDANDCYIVDTDNPYYNDDIFDEHESEYTAHAKAIGVRLIEMVG